MTTKPWNEVVVVPEPPPAVPAPVSAPAPIDFASLPAEPELSPADPDPPPPLAVPETPPAAFDPPSVAAVVASVPEPPPPVVNDGGTAPPPEADFLVADTGWAMRVTGQTVADNALGTRPLFERDAVIAFRPGVDVQDIGLSPFEAHVASFIDGGRPVARIAVKANLSVDDLAICLGMLADRGILERVGTAMTAQPEVLTTEERDADVIARLKAEALAEIYDDDDDDDDEPAFASPPVTAPAIVSTSEVQTPQTTGAVANAAARPATPAPVDGPKKTRPATAPAQRTRQLSIDPATGQVIAVEVSKARPKTPKAPVRPEPTALTPKERHAKKAWKLAVADIEAGRLPRALGHLRMAIQLAPRDPLYRAMMSNWGRVGEVLSGELAFDAQGKALGEDKRFEAPPATDPAASMTSQEQRSRLSGLFRKKA